MQIPHPSTFDPFAPDVIQNPYPYFQSLRTHAPVYKAPNVDYYVVSRMADIRKATLDTATFSSNFVAILLKATDGKAQLLKLPQLGGAAPVDVLALQDPPVHARQRKIAQGAFSTRIVKSLEDSLRQRVDAMLDKLGGGRVELMHGFAFRYPLAVILDVLGLPAEDLDRIKAWTDDAIGLLNGISGPQELIKMGNSGAQFYSYLVEKARAALERPGDNLFGVLAQNTGAGGADVLSFDELASTVLQLVIAGSESSASTIGNAVKRLAEDQASQRHLRANPGDIPAFIEEVLRLDSPFQGHFRLTTRDAELGGVNLRQGERLMLLWASGNRDESEFVDAASYALGRDNVKQHLAFGHGIHHCLGAPLARLEAKIALERWLARSRHFEMAGDVGYVGSVFVRTLTALPLDVEAA